MKNIAETNKANAMSLGEVLITVGILGVIAAIVMPVMQNVLPDKYEALHKKGDYALEHTLASIVNDEYLYSQLFDEDDNPINLLRNVNPVNVNGVSYNGADKLCQLFASKFSLYPGGDGVDCSATPKFKSDGGRPTFVSNDGIQWLFPTSDFQDGNSIPIAFRSSKEEDRNATHCAVINPDVIPTSALSALGFSSTKNGNTSFYETSYDGDCKKPDTYVYMLTDSGKLYTSNSTSDNLKPTNTAFINTDFNPIPAETGGMATNPGPSSPNITNNSGLDPNIKDGSSNNIQNGNEVPEVAGSDASNSRKDTPGKPNNSNGVANSNGAARPNYGNNHSNGNETTGKYGAPAQR